MVQADRLILKRPLIVIAGPTATGKTALAVALAKRIDGEIVSADSMQIYREMKAGTAKPTLPERDGVRYRMIDIVSCREPYSVGRYVRDARAEIAEVVSLGKEPILVGGTGLYIRSLLYGFDFGDKAANETTRSRYAEMTKEMEEGGLHRLLKERNPLRAAQIHPNDTVRLIRALELTDSCSKGALSKLKVPHLLFALDGDRESVYRRINDRVDRMIESGLIQEVETLLKGGVSPDAQSMQAIGYKEIVSYLKGEYGLTDAIERLKRNTRRYAKRQLTYFRHMEGVYWLNINDTTDSMCDIIEEQYRNAIIKEFRWTLND